MVYVLDSSFVGSIIIPDEKKLNIISLYAKIGRDEEKFVPHLFWYEIANIYHSLIRRKRYTYNEVLELFPMLDSFSLIDDFETGLEYSKELLRLCNDYSLTSYDAAYLELARRKNAVLCTLDDGLQAAAKKTGVVVLK